MRIEAQPALDGFQSVLESIVVIFLLDVVTPDEVNDYYGYVNGHPLADMLRSIEDERSSRNLLSL